MNEPITHQTYEKELRDGRTVTVIIEGKEKSQDAGRTNAFFCLFDYHYTLELQRIVEDNLQLVRNRIKAEGKNK